MITFLVLGMLLVSCGDAGVASPSPRAPVEVGKLTLTTAACRLEPSVSTLARGPSSIAVVNGTDATVIADLSQLASGHDFAEWAANIRQAREAAENGQAGVKRPAYILGATTLELGARGTGRLTATLTPGTWGIVCLRFYENVGQRRPYVLIGPIEVR